MLSWQDPRTSSVRTPTSATTSARHDQCAVGFRNWMARAPSALRRRRQRATRPPVKDEVEHGRLEQPCQDQWVAEADEIGAEYTKRRGVDEADIAWVHVLHLKVQVSPCRTRCAT